MARALMRTGARRRRAPTRSRAAIEQDLAAPASGRPTSSGSKSLRSRCSASRTGRLRWDGFGATRSSTSSTCRSSCSSAAPPAPASRRSPTEVAHRLGITRVTSTDFVRQTMRAFFSPEFMPSIHYSSFEAGRALPTAPGGGGRSAPPRLPRADAPRARRRQGRDRPRARGGLVDGARRRPPRARDGAAADRERARRRTA